jgi:hypothetical protein
LRIDALNFAPTMSSEKPGNSGLGSARPQGPAGKSPANAAPAPQTIGGQERRRGQRVLLRIRANIHVALQGQATTLEVATLSVNPCGALVVVKQSLPPETRLVLEHKGTKERIACKVARAPREMPEGFHVALEFDSPAPGFWKIAFPPADWRPDDL